MNAGWIVTLVIIGGLLTGIILMMTGKPDDHYSEVIDWKEEDGDELLG